EVARRIGRPYPEARHVGLVPDLPGRAAAEVAGRGRGEGGEGRAGGGAARRRHAVVESVAVIEDQQDADGLAVRGGDQAVPGGEVVLAGLPLGVAPREGGPDPADARRRQLVDLL